MYIMALTLPRVANLLNGKCRVRGWGGPCKWRKRKVSGVKGNWLQGQKAGMGIRRPRENAVLHSLLYRGGLYPEWVSHESSWVIDTQQEINQVVNKTMCIKKKKKTTKQNEKNLRGTTNTLWSPLNCPHKKIFNTRTFPFSRQAFTTESEDFQTITWNFLETSWGSNRTRVLPSFTFLLKISLKKFLPSENKRFPGLDTAPAAKSWIFSHWLSWMCMQWSGNISTSFIRHMGLQSSRRI